MSWVGELSEECRVCFGIVASMSLSRILALFIYSYDVYPLFVEFVFWMRHSYVCVVQRLCNFDICNV